MPNMRCLMRGIYNVLDAAESFVFSRVFWQEAYDDTETINPLLIIVLILEGAKTVVSVVDNRIKLRDISGGVQMDVEASLRTESVVTRTSDDFPAVTIPPARDIVVRDTVAPISSSALTITSCSIALAEIPVYGPMLLFSSFIVRGIDNAQRFVVERGCQDIERARKVSDGLSIITKLVASLGPASFDADGEPITSTLVASVCALVIDGVNTLTITTHDFYRNRSVGNCCCFWGSNNEARARLFSSGGQATERHEEDHTTAQSRV